MTVLPDDPSDRQRSFLDEEMAEEKFETRGLLLRWSAGFCLLFAGVFFAFWWSGSAIRFGAGRVAATNEPTYRVWGVVCDAQSGEPIPWAVIEDDPAGNSPYFRTDADMAGVYHLLTLAEPHRLRISAIGHRAATVNIGKPWFIWWPRGEERHDVKLPSE